MLDFGRLEQFVVPLGQDRNFTATIIKMAQYSSSEKQLVRFFWFHSNAPLPRDDCGTAVQYSGK